MASSTTGVHLLPHLERWFSAEQAATLAPHGAQLLIVPGEAVGTIRFGMARTEVEETLGRPQMTMGPKAAEYLLLGLAIIYDGEVRVHTILGGGGTIDSPLTAAFKGRTASGIGTGSCA